MQATAVSLRSALVAIALWQQLPVFAETPSSSEIVASGAPEHKVMDLMFELCLPWSIGTLDVESFSFDGFSAPEVASPLDGSPPYVFLQEQAVSGRDAIYVGVTKDSCEVILFQGTTGLDHKQFIEERLRSEVMGQKHDFQAKVIGAPENITVFSYLDDEGDAFPVFAMDNGFDGREAYLSTDSTIGLRLFALKTLE